MPTDAAQPHLTRACASADDGWQIHYAPLRILLAEAHQPFREMMRRSITRQEDMLLVAEATEGADVVRQARALRPAGLDLVLMDLEMPGLNGMQATRELISTDPTLPIVMLTVASFDRDLGEAIRAGAIGFLSKGLSSEAIVRALRGFHQDESLPLPRLMASKVLAHFARCEWHADPAGVADPGLSRREHEVLELIALGAHDREIATQFGLAEGTVKKHVQNILRKLHARNRAEAVARLRNSAAPAPGRT